MVAWKPNASLDNVMVDVAWQERASFRERLALRVCLIRPAKRHQLEAAMTEMALEAGAIALEGSSVVDGVYVGDWGAPGFLTWIIDNWPKIMEMILAIIALF
jgi:hypothetical protein